MFKVFLDISKAFSKVWQKGITFKLKQHDISGELLNLSCDFLRNRKQRVILNRQVLTSPNVNTGVPQGSILWLLLILIYIDDIADELSNAILLADDALLFSVVHNVNTSVTELNNDLNKIDKCGHTNDKRVSMQILVNKFKRISFL